MRVAVVNAYDRDNAGDAALLSVLLSQARQACPGVELCYAGLEDPRCHPSFEGARNVGSIRRWVGDPTATHSARVARKAAAVGLALLPSAALRWLSRRTPAGSRREPWQEIAALDRCDLVVGLGGGYLNGSPEVAGTLNVLFLLLPLWLAVRLGRPVLLAPQSYGPFGTPLQRLMVRVCLNRIDRIVVREDVSLGILRAIGVDGARLERGVDGAFALPASGPTPGPGREISAAPAVAITARAWLTGPAQEHYERSLAAFADWLIEARGATVTLVPQVTATYGGDDDRLVSRRVASYCTTTPAVIDSRHGFRELRALYSRFDYLVGTRFHSVIFAVSGGTPALAIGYEHKTAGIMDDLDLGAWVIPIELVSAELLRARFDTLVSERSAYEVTLKETLPAYVDRAHAFVDVLHRSLA